VSIVDAGKPGGVATRGSWGWINASWGHSQPYFSLRIRAMEEWQALQHDLPVVSVNWAGGLFWDLGADELQTFATQFSSWGYGVRRIGRTEVLRIEPNLTNPPDVAAYVASEGAAEPVEVTQALLAAASELGARVMSHTRVQSLVPEGDRIRGVLTDHGRIDSDEVIVAAGSETAVLAATAGFALPTAGTPGLLVVSKPHERLLNGLVMGPTVYLRQSSAGRLIGCADFDRISDPTAAAMDLFHEIKATVKPSVSLQFDYSVVAHRPQPKDGLPAVGRFGATPGIYLAIMHSGVTLAPLIGRLVADEIITGRRNKLLDPYGPREFS
jgi:glycine/D-amino acid oxidase-like deaminating enzyme